MSQRSSITPAEAQRPLFAGIDLGGTNIKAGIVDDRGHVVAYTSVASQIEKGPESGAQRMAEAVHQVAAEVGVEIEDIARVGLATPGTMDIPAGMLLDPVNLPGWQHFPIRDRVAHHVARPVSYANDAAAAAYGEFWVGTGSQYASMVLLTLGTGVGGGIIIGDVSIDGENSHGSECGHIIIDSRDDSRMCSCGQRGHLEAYASATGVISRTEEALDSGRASKMRDSLADGQQLTPLLIHRAAEAGDSLALEIILETARYLGIGITTLLHTVDPAAVVLGGAMNFGGGDNKIGQQFLARIKQEVHQRAFPVIAERITIDFASLEGDAGFIGAAGIARVDYRIAQ